MAAFATRNCGWQEGLTGAGIGSLGLGVLKDCGTSSGTARLPGGKVRRTVWVHSLTERRAAGSHDHRALHGGQQAAARTNTRLLQPRCCDSLRDAHQ